MVIACVTSYEKSGGHDLFVVDTEKMKPRMKKRFDDTFAGNTREYEVGLGVGEFQGFLDSRLSGSSKDFLHPVHVLSVWVEE